MTRKIWSKNEVEFIKNNISSISIKEMANYFNVSYQKMSDKIHKLGLNKKKESGILWTKEEDALLITNYEYAPKNKIQSLLPNRKWTAITQRANNTLKLKRSTSDRFDINYNFFNTLTKEGAYILGFIMSDGHIFYERGNRKDSGLQFEIADYDVDILNKIKDILLFEGSVKTSKRSTVKLSISNKKILKDLISLGIPKTNKTYDAKMPVMDKEFIQHFVRGYFDGDGSVYKHGNSIRITFLGTKDLIHSLKESIPFDLSNISVQDRNKYGINVYALSISGKKAIDILDWIYKDSTIHLDRKYNKYNEFCNKSVTS